MNMEMLSQDTMNIFTINGKRTTQRMHRLIMNCPKGLLVDHKNHDGLDNRKCNLRLCTNAENQYNQKPLQKKTSSQYRGINWQKRIGKWDVWIQLNGKSIFLGSFSNEIEAAKAYDKKAKELFGEFAHLNATGSCSTAESLSLRKSQECKMKHKLGMIDYMQKKQVTRCSYCGKEKEGLSFIIGASDKPDWCMVEGTAKMCCPNCYEKAQAEAKRLKTKILGDN